MGIRIACAAYVEFQEVDLHLVVMMRMLSHLHAIAVLKLMNIDRTIRVWSSNGYQLQELHGHTNFIYSIAALPNGDLVSAGEDRTVRIWRSMKLSCLAKGWEEPR